MIANSTLGGAAATNPVGTSTLRIFLAIAMLSLSWVELVTMARHVTSQLLRG